MELSDDTKNLLAAMDEFTEHALRKRNDFGTIFELAAAYGHADAMEKLVFESAAVWKLASKIKKAAGGDEGFHLIKREFESSVQKMLSFIREIMANAENQTTLRFEENYYDNSRGNLLNLIDLAHDFARFKDLQREIRSQRQ